MKLWLYTIKFTMASSVLISSCASTSYEGPLTDQTTKVRFASMGVEEGDTNIFHNSAWVSIDEYPAEDCHGKKKSWDTLVHMGTLWSNPQRLGIPLEPSIHKNAYTELTLDAEKTHHLLFRGGADQFGGTNYDGGFKHAYYHCAVPINEKLAENKQYEIAYYQPTLKSCHVIINEIRGIGASAQKSFIKRVENTVPENMTGCKEAFTKSDWF